MIAVLCEKHEEEWRENHLATPRLPDEGWFTWSMRVRTVNNKDCPDCILLGLSKHGRVEELSSPEDWTYSNG